MPALALASLWAAPRRAAPLRVEPPRVEPPRVEPPRVEPPRVEPPRVASPWLASLWLGTLLAVLALGWWPTQVSARNLSKELRKVHRAGSGGGGVWAVVVRPLDSRNDKRTFEADAQLRLTGASTCKLFTAYTAAALLPPDTTFVTFARSPAPLVLGVLAGDLWLVGRGAPEIRTVARPGAALFDSASSFAAAPAVPPLDQLALALREAGLRTVQGQLRVDDSFFDAADTIGRGWQWEDLQWWFAARVSATVVDLNTIELVFNRLSQGRVEMVAPALPAGWTLVNEVHVGPAREGTDIRVAWTGPRRAVIDGRLNPGESPHREIISVPRSELYAADRFREALERAGIVLQGGRNLGRFGEEPGRELARLAVPRLRDLYPPILGRSQNLDAEMLLRDLGAAREGADSGANGRSIQGSVAGGLAVVYRELARIGLGESDFRLVDGSGLSRMDYCTADALARVLESAVRRADAGDSGMAALLDGLARPGEPGSLHHRFEEPDLRARGRDWLMAKTGSMGGVNALAGIVMGADGQRYVVVSIRNLFPESPEQAHAWETALLREVAETR